MPTGNVRTPPARAAANRAIALRFDADRLVIQLKDGRELSIPLEHYPTLFRATPRERDQWEILGAGRALHWELLDLDLSVEGLLNGLSERIPHPPLIKPPKQAPPSVGTEPRRGKRRAG